MNRREFLKTSLAASAVLFLNENGWAARAMGDQKSRKRLVVILLRGAVDGLNVVVPYSESAYYSARPTIAIPRPNENGGVLPLDNHFGLHPAPFPDHASLGAEELRLCSRFGVARPQPLSLRCPRLHGNGNTGGQNDTGRMAKPLIAGLAGNTRHH